eukprot:CAMPEP_0201476858 /NCGR_PEP_ID=MMETSP0151_2-20130828/1981_1 /ASSEMBLY_ACC=CAM_ASM_000257 /TAXON_ID=200890 /ORGANISM="Paramoeba atlantica, Strain 621/1 / CCAP 1560/9" /LENGTH=413 /DNA_ID=CAMNT_0047857367 /DNA_START=1839 /DNA_END=3077 /DNA_ORIENTATION=-
MERRRRNNGRMFFLSLLVVLIFGDCFVRGDEECNGWSIVTNCYDSKCYHFSEEDMKCRGNGGFEFADEKRCILPYSWTSLENCQYENETSFVCHSIEKKEFCRKVDGFLYAKKKYCAASGDWSLLSGPSSNNFVSLSSNCRMFHGNNQSCTLKGEWTIISNCVGDDFGNCFDDLEQVCQQDGGLYYHQYQVASSDSYPACAFPSVDYFSYDCSSSSSKDDENCCPNGILFNNDQSCLLQGEWTNIPNANESSCQENNGSIVDNDCIIQGKWSLITSEDERRLEEGCGENDGIPFLFDEMSGCAFQGNWTSLFCLNGNNGNNSNGNGDGDGDGDGDETSVCQFDSDLCLQIGFLVDEGCVAQGEWTLLDLCTPDNDCYKECDFHQCSVINGIVYDNCTVCAAPTRCHKYDPTVW